MAKKRLRDILKKYLTDREIEKLEKMFSEDGYMSRKERINHIKKLIKSGEYNIPAEKVAEKMLEFFKKNS